MKHCNVNKVKSTRDKVKGDKVKNGDVKWENVRRTSEIINRKEKDDAWKVRKYKKLMKIKEIINDKW